MSSHRKAPLPESMKRGRTGWCGWCDKANESTNGKPTRRSWHPACVKAFKLIHWPAETRAAVWIRDRGICQRCKRDIAAEAHAKFPRGTVESLRAMLPSWAPAWQHDHIRPLIEANGDITFWHLDNIQVLCHPCHVAKGREDNARRRQQKAEAQQPVLL